MYAGSRRLVWWLALTTGVEAIACGSTDYKPLPEGFGQDSGVGSGGLGGGGTGGSSGSTASGGNSGTNATGGVAGAGASGGTAGGTGATGGGGSGGGGTGGSGGSGGAAADPTGCVKSFAPDKAGCIHCCREISSAPSVNSALSTCMCQANVCASQCAASSCKKPNPYTTQPGDPCDACWLQALSGTCSAPWQQYCASISASTCTDVPACFTACNAL